MVTGIVIPTAGDQPLELREFAKLEDYQSAVGGWIEALDLPDIGITVYVNDEGRIRKLPHNARASFLRWYWSPLTRASGMLAGDAVLVGMPNGAGESTDVPVHVRELLLTSALFALEMRTEAHPEWQRSTTALPDYWSALVWTMMLTEHFTGLRDVRIVPLAPTIDDV
ncbi:DUF3846 domain-containing protein [uncultured Microbacterium sp.]|mgnify:CR=1 FL=1|uniref:DUF3846 domain-containing protein n=1 Tax=uncultured Microbacterium sp. TaxID=191216 RepID=UPI002621306A|nr:DUF3846 domain-containing protein [uncultured Microbacterium sp.]